MTTERDLIQRLADALHDAAEDVEGWGNYASIYFQEKHDLSGNIAKIHALANEARAFLAQTEPQGPTQEEAVALYSEVMAVHECQTLGEMAEHFSHAVLARWGRHAIEPPAKLAHNTAQHSGQRP